MEGTGGKVDIALQGDGRLVALVEAKAPYIDLSQHVEQVLRYAFHEGVDICVLTTGLDWWLVPSSRKGRMGRTPIRGVGLDERFGGSLAEDLSAFLHRETLVSGQAEAKAKLVLKASLAAARLREGDP